LNFSGFFSALPSVSSLASPVALPATSFTFPFARSTLPLCDLYLSCTFFVVCDRRSRSRQVTIFQQTNFQAMCTRTRPVPVDFRHRVCDARA
jgi:hypothetical protein